MCLDIYFADRKTIFVDLELQRDFDTFTIISICTVYIVMSCGVFCNFKRRKQKMLFFLIMVTIIATVKVTI